MEKFVSENNKKNLFITFIIFFVLILVTVIYSNFFNNNITESENILLDEDSRLETVVEEGPIEKNNKNKKNNDSDEDEFIFIINKKIVFKDSKSFGNVKIENPETNKYNFYVTVKLDNSDDIIYQSPVLEPNQHIKNDYLSTKLSKGLYKAVATIFVIDPETKEELAQNQVNIQIQIKK